MSPAKSAPSLQQVVAALRRHQGAAPAPISRDPFRLVLYEQVGYLAPDAQRRAAYRRLEREVGLTPAAILDASPKVLESIARAGGAIAVRLRAARMRLSAKLVSTKWDGQLRRATRLPLPQARAALAKFPMIGRPGAERILATAGAHAVLGLDSNAMRALLRLGWGKEGRQYAATYQSVQAAAAGGLPAEPRALAAAAAILRRHGQEICRRTAPACDECPLAGACAYALRRSRAKPRHRS